MELKTYLQTNGRGSLTKLAHNIKAHLSDLSNWSNGVRPVPPYMCYRIEVATKGLVSRKDTRPNDWKLLWPELSND